MIEVTDKMITAFVLGTPAKGIRWREDIAAGLTAVLAIVERDHLAKLRAVEAWLATYPQFDTPTPGDPESTIVWRLRQLLTDESRPDAETPSREGDRPAR